MAYVYDYINGLIDVTSPQTSVDCQDLYNSLCEQQASVEGICFEPIGAASGKQVLNSNTQVGITVSLLNVWQLKFFSGEYVASVSGGNLVADNTNGAVAYTPGVQVLLVQSAASTLVTNTSSGSDSSIFSTMNPPGTYPLGSIGQQIQKSAALAGIALNA